MIKISDILTRGKYYVLDDHALRQETYGKVINGFLEGIEAIESRACRDKVAAEGLSNIHKHFPVEKTALLEDFLLGKLRDDLYYWSFKVGREQLGLNATFYVDDLIMVRIHYPFLEARKAKAKLKPPFPLGEKLKIGVATLKNWRMALGKFDVAKRKQIGRAHV